MLSFRYYYENVMLVRILWTLHKATAIFRKQSQSGVPSIAAEILKYSYQTTIEIAELSH